MHESHVRCTAREKSQFAEFHGWRGLARAIPDSGITWARGPAQPYSCSARGWLGVVCSNGAKSIDELGRTVLCIKLSQCKLRVSIWRGRLVFAIFPFLRNPISDLPLQHFTCWLVPILQMPLCHRGNISPEIISMAIWHSLCKLHLAVACKIVCRNHLALTKS